MTPLARLIDSSVWGFARLRLGLARLALMLACSLATWVPSAQAVEWAKNFGTNGSTERVLILVTAEDTAGNVIVAGTYNSLTLPLGSITIDKIDTATGMFGGDLNDEIFVAKFDASGNTLWAKSLGGMNTRGTPTGLATDASNNIFLSGYFSGMSGFPTSVNGNFTTPPLTKISQNPIYNDVFAVKFNNAGDIQWAKNFGGANTDVVAQMRNGIAVDSAGDVLLAAEFEGGNLDTPTLTKVGVADVFALKLASADGSPVWVKQLAGAGGAWATVRFKGITVDSSKDVYVAGFTNGTLDTSPATSPGQIGPWDLFAVKLIGTSGATSWSKNFGASGSSPQVSGVAADATGKVIVTGTFSVDFTTPVLAKIGSGTSGFAMALNGADGSVSWSQAYGSTAAAFGLSMNAPAIDSIDNSVYLGGYFYSGNLTTPALSLTGGGDAFVFKLNSSGLVTQARGYGGASANASGFGLTVHNQVFHVGGSFDSADLTSPALTKIGFQDAFLIADTFAAKYSVGGNVTGLSSGSVELQNNLGDDLTVSANAAFTFVTTLISGRTYAVTVKTQPPGQTCLVSSGGDTASTNVTNVAVNCAASTYAITTTASPSLGGTVTCSPNPVTHGSNSTCTANANTGYTFSAFSGDCSGATCSLSNVTAAKAVTASFTQNSYAITTSASPSLGGTVTCSPNPVTHGSNSTCTANANTGYTFSAFSGDCSGTTCTLSSVTAAKSVTATFTQNSYTITTTASPSLGGTVTCTANPVAHGSSSTCTANANTGYTFSTFSGDCTGATCSLSNVTAAKSVTATFTQNTYSITTTASPTAGGTVSCTPNPVSHGSSSTCTASANTGYTFSAFSGDCSGATCSLSNVTAAKAVTASFTQNSYAITTTASPSLGGTVTCTANPVAHGSNSTCTANANTGYTFSVFSGDCSGATCTLSSVTAAKSVTATFTQNSYPITTTTSPSLGGTVSCTPNPVSHGSSSTCTASANTGYTFSAFSGDCSGATCSLSNVTAAKAVTASFTQNSYAIGGSVGGLSGSVVLQNNLGNDLTLSASGSFTFTTAISHGGAYAVTVKTQPSGQTCSVSSGSGTATANVTNVAVSCSANTYTIGGSVSGLSGSVVLQNNLGNDLTVSANGSFTFTTAISHGGAYAVTVKTQPSGQTCSVSSGSGTATANVTNVAVSCSANTYTIGGSVSGLSGSVVLQNNLGNDLTLSASGSFTFTTAISHGGAYAVTVKTQPSGQTCSVSSGSGTATANVINVAVSCSANTYTIGGSVSGLSGSVVLQNNLGNDLTVSASGSFTFTTAISHGGAYAVTVKTQPSGQTCSVSSGSGTATANVTAVSVSCSANPVNNTFPGPSPTTPGRQISTTISGGALGCGFATAQYEAPTVAPPPGMVMPHGVLAFTTTACGNGATINLSITYPEELPQGAKFYKYGPEPGNPLPHWFELTGVSISGATVSYSITDNGAGDSNPAEGIITDPAGYAVFTAAGAASIPTLSEWGMILLSALLALVAMTTIRRRV
jgi:Fe-S cluster biogenesis protein NfuA